MDYRLRFSVVIGRIEFPHSHLSVLLFQRTQKLVVDTSDPSVIGTTKKDIIFNFGSL